MQLGAGLRTIPSTPQPIAAQNFLRLRRKLIAIAAIFKGIWFSAQPNEQCGAYDSNAFAPADALKCPVNSVSAAKKSIVRSPPKLRSRTNRSERDGPLLRYGPSLSDLLVRERNFGGL